MIDDFIAAKRAEGCSVGTCAQYRWHLQRLESYCQPGPMLPTRAQVRRYIAGLHDVYKPATVKVAITVIRSFCGWLVAEGLLTENPAAGFKVPRLRRTVQRTLSAAELAAMLGCCDDSPKGLRDAAILSLLADSGLRRAELVSLTMRHVDFDRLLLVGFVRKGGSTGWAAFGTATAARLRRWLAVRCAYDTDALFVAVGGSTPGRPLTGDGLKTIVRKRGHDCGIANVTPHAFRRSFACLLVEAGAPTRLVQELGGWSDVRQVERYTRALDAQRLAAGYSVMDNLGANGKHPSNGHMRQTSFSLETE